GAVGVLPSGGRWGGTGEGGGDAEIDTGGGGDGARPGGSGGRAGPGRRSQSRMAVGGASRARRVLQRRLGRLLRALPAEEVLARDHPSLRLAGLPAGAVRDRPV